MVYINHEYKFIFIENPKSGSTTIYKALEKIFGSNQRKTPEEAHKTCREIKEMLPTEWETYLKITTWRDPYRRLCSSVNYPKHYEGHYNSVEEFLIHRNPSCVYCKPQEEFTYECDVILKLENLQNDFNKLCHRLGVKPITLTCNNHQDTPKRFFGLLKIKESIDINV